MKTQLTGKRLALTTFLAGGIVGATVGWSADRAPMTPSAVQVGDAPLVQTASSPVAAKVQPEAGRRTTERKSLVVVIPSDNAYVSSTSIPVAGMAFGRPHGPQIRSVQVELYVGDTLVDRTELEVFSSRFAGLLELRTPLSRTDAELRVSYPTRPTGPVVVRQLTIDVPSSGLDPLG